MKTRYWLPATVLATVVASVTACDIITGPDPVPSDLRIVEGDAQVDTVGASVAPLVVEVRDEEARLFEGAAVQWAVVEGEASVAPAAAETDQNGVASAVVTLGTRAGPVEVRASVGSTLTATFSLTAVPDRPAVVAPEADSVRLDALEDSVRVGAEVFDRYGNEITDPPLEWTTSDSGLVDLSADGLIRSLAPGTASVVIRADTAATNVAVVIEQTPTTATVTPSSARLTALDDTTPLTAAAYDRNGHEIEGAGFDWSTGDADVATVSDGGMVTAAGPGEASITATAGEAAATATVRVEQEIAVVALRAVSDTLRDRGDTLRMKATARDRNGHAIPGVSFTWESNRSSLVSVDGTGLLTAGSGRGDARITARAGGFSDTKYVTRIPYGVLVLTFDDAHEQVHTRILPLVEKRGLVANVALPTGWVGRTGSAPRLTEAQIRELHEAGWSIVPHSVDHSDLTGLSASELDRQLRESRQWVRDRGYGGSSVFVVPFHRWYQREEEAIEKYYEGARGYGIEHSRHGGMVDWPASDPYLLTSIPGDRHFDTASGRRQIEDWWAEAVSKGKFLGIYFHRIADEDMAALEDVLERLAKYRAHLRTYADLFE